MGSGVGLRQAEGPVGRHPAEDSGKGAGETATKLAVEIQIAVGMGTLKR